MPIDGVAADPVHRICLDWKLPFTTSYHTKFPEYVAARLPLPISAGWHARYDADPEHRWLRTQVQDIASELAGTAVAGTAASSARVQSR